MEIRYKFTCNKCNRQCIIDGEYPKFFCWCNNCDDYALGFDCLEYAADYQGQMIDYVYDRIKDGDL